MTCEVKWIHVYCLVLFVHAFHPNEVEDDSARMFTGCLKLQLCHPIFILLTKVHKFQGSGKAVSASIFYVALSLPPIS